MERSSTDAPAAPEAGTVGVSTNPSLSVRPSRRSSLQFGLAPSFEELKRQKQDNQPPPVVAAAFWYGFRTSLHYTAPVAFVVCFVLPFFLWNNSNGFTFCGSMLSLASGVLVLLSYAHIVPWRRHPSWLLLQISICSFVLAVIFAFNSAPFSTQHSYHTGGLNVADAGNYESHRDHAIACQVQSFFLQLALLSREMWVFSLSMDLVTSITNPFASYKTNVRKYHLTIGVVGFSSALVLLVHRTCQGQFLSNGTCWLRLSGSIYNPCFWGFFMAWKLFFYVVALVTLTFAYRRIAKGLDSTYATRFACVAATFRVVFFYIFFFGFLVVLGITLLRVHDLLPQRQVDQLANVFTYVIASRGYFDALVWFFSHGFSSHSSTADPNQEFLEQRPAVSDVEDESITTSAFKSSLHRTAEHFMHQFEIPAKPMKEIMGPFWAMANALRCMVRSLCRFVARCCCCQCSSMELNDEDKVANSGQSDDSTSDDQLTSRLLPAPCPADEAQQNVALSSSGDDESRSSAKFLGGTNRPILPTIQESDSRGNTTTNSNSFSASQSFPSASSGTTPGYDPRAFSDLDLSPQLNFALRSELLFLVSMGIRESVVRLNQRELQILVSHSSNGGNDYYSSPSSQHSQKNVNGFSGNQQQSSPSGSGQYIPHQSFSSMNSHQDSRLSSLARYFPRYSETAPVPNHIYHPAINAPIEKHLVTDPQEQEQEPLSSSSQKHIQQQRTFTPSSDISGQGAVEGTSYYYGSSYYGFGQSAHHPNPQTISYSCAAGSNTSALQYALQSVLCSVTGGHVPGEYGVDPFSVHCAAASTSTTAATALGGAAEDVGYHTEGTLSSRESSLRHPPNGRPSLSATYRDSLQTPRPSNLSTAHQAPQQVQVPRPQRTRNTLTSIMDEESSSVGLDLEEGCDTDADSEGESVFHKTAASTLADAITSAAHARKAATSSGRMRWNRSGGLVGASSPGVPSPGHGGMVVPAPAEVVFNLNEKHQFRDFRPASFRHMRQMSGLTEDEYLHLVSQPTKERLSEGASGAFFFFCGEGDLIVKTVEKHEAHTLLAILDRYLQYLQDRPDSLLVRFLGLHSLRMYGNEFTFVVMKNIFPPHVRINERYDIKGSWVNRHVQRKPPGTRVTCRYCNEYFFEGSNERCPEVVGGHEAVMTFKDNDMISKLRLRPEHAFSLIDTLNSDSDALASMGLTDYSLLVGVRTTQYDIEALQAQQAETYNGSRDSSECKIGMGAASESSEVKQRGSITLATTNRISFAVDSSTPHAQDDEVGAADRNGDHIGQSAIPQPSELATAAPPALKNSSRKVEKANEDNEHEWDLYLSGYPARAVIAPSAYHIGTIDILQTWNWSKRLEWFFKVHILQHPREGISCMPPNEFRTRFQQKVSRLVEHSIFVREVTGSWHGKRDISVSTLLDQHGTIPAGTKKKKS